MKITTKLAYSQLKVNKSRTMLTLIAIALATALATAVCSFVASGNAMIIDFLGEDYGEYGHSYFLMLLIPAIIFGILIIGMSITVISNVFRISARERVTQFGILKCTGATQKQIQSTVMAEALLLCILGIPAGICIGLILAACGMQVANHYLNELNDLVHIMVTEIHLELSFVFSWSAILASAMLSFLTVLYSAWRPASKAAKTSAINCIRGVEPHPEKGKTSNEKPFKKNYLVEKLFGFEGTLANLNLKRNSQNFRATVISLSAGVVLFISLSGLGSLASEFENYMYGNTQATVMSDYTSGYTRDINAKTGRSETTFLYPVDAACGNTVTQKLEQFDNVDVFGIGCDRDTYYTELPKEMVLPAMQAAYGEAEAQTFEFPVELILLDDENYEKLCRTANVPVGSTILLNHYSYNDFGEEKHLEAFSPELSELSLKKADGSSVSVSIQGSLTKEHIPNELFYINTNPLRIVVPDAMVREFTWQCSPTDIEGFITYSNQVLQNIFPSEIDSSYMEEGFDVRVYKMDEYIKVMNIALSLASVFLYSFAGLLMLIGLTNVISTLSTNVLMRAREFAVLKSVGMTPENMKRMLRYECILCSSKALIYGIPIGVAITFFVNLPIRTAFPIPYKIPLLMIGICVIMVFIIIWGITVYAAHKLKKQNIIETIRAESGR